MSRIGKRPVELPAGVTAELVGQHLSVKGKKGKLTLTVADDVAVAREGNAIVLKPRVDSKQARALWGLHRSQINSMVRGVAEGFVRQLEINGVGYRAAVQGRKLNLQLGYSHDVSYDIPAGIDVVCERPTAISVSGIDKQKVGQVAAEIRAFRGPEPYKGKGIKFVEETIFRKEGKKK
ncbi:MAG: 50S ribosomal protein L6 [Alphaproteobacteria bacterium]|nr:50S ribosomal protein L6 [Alphaproteobacteria bacterium]